MQHGDVVVTQESAPQSHLPVVPKVLASAATVAMVTKESEVDQLQINDPWAVSKVAKPGPVPVQIGNPIEDMEQRVVAAVLAQMPSKNMEIDQDSDHQDRVVKLEQQMQGLQQHTQQLGITVQQQHTEHTKQIQEVHHQLQQQQHFDAAIQAQAGQIQGFLDSFQEQFRQQVVHQQSMLDSMFQKQMTQFESLLSKRARQE
jgi:exonuclease VII large subunit